jgi:hypothetical protein
MYFGFNLKMREKKFVKHTRRTRLIPVVQQTCLITFRNKGGGMLYWRDSFSAIVADRMYDVTLMYEIKPSSIHVSDVRFL